MHRITATTAFAALLLTLSMACSPQADVKGTPESEGGYKRPKVWPKPTEPPPASPIYHDVEGKVPTEEEIERAAGEHNAMLEAGIEGALLEGDLVTREIAFAQLLPELLQVEPQRLIALHARMKPGEPRDTLRQEMARYWASSDPAAASQWMKSLEGEERRSAVVAAVTTLAVWDPTTALSLVAEFDLESVREMRTLLAELKKASKDAAQN
jgi:hypothetical protein